MLEAEHSDERAERSIFCIASKKERDEEKRKNGGQQRGEKKSKAKGLRDLA